MHGRRSVSCSHNMAASSHLGYDIDSLEKKDNTGVNTDGITLILFHFFQVNHCFQNISSYESMWNYDVHYINTTANIRKVIGLPQNIAVITRLTDVICKLYDYNFDQNVVESETSKFVGFFLTY